MTTPKATTRPTVAPYECYRVLSPPNQVSYVFGTIVTGSHVAVRGLPCQYWDGHLVAILSADCFIEVARTNVIVYSPLDDATWLARHPYFHSENLPPADGAVA